jgi:hypothetical protein
VQVVPLRVKVVGAVLEVPLVAMKPTVTEPAAEMVEVQDAGVTLTAAPFRVGVPPHMPEMPPPP